MQDIINHTRHTDGFCRACRTYTKGEALKASARRTKRLIEDIWGVYQTCPHTNTRVRLWPAVEERGDLVLESEGIKVCTDCGVMTELAR